MDKKLICFIHIERSGGTTLHHVLRRTSINYYSIPSNRGKYGINLSVNNLNRLLKALPFITGVGGHTLKSFMKYEEFINREISYFTFLRNPIDRYLSQYNYILKYFNKDLTFDDYLSNKRFQNFIVKHICGEEELDKAVKEIDKYDFVGFTDDYEESIDSLGTFLGVKYSGIENIIPINSIDKNKTNFITSLNLNPYQYKKALHNNVLDIELYKYVKENLSKFRSESQSLNNEKHVYLQKSHFLSDYLIKGKRLFVERFLFDKILKNEI